MLIDRLHKLFLCLVMALFAGCSGGGGDPGTPSPAPVPVATTGSLQLAINNLPAGTGAAVRVTGPNNFVRDVAASQTLADLAPGAYSIAATPVTIGAATWTPAPSTQSAVVSAGATVTATVAYSTAPPALALSEVANGLDGPVFLAAPPGDTRQFIVERGGRIRILQDGSLRSLPFLDIGARVAAEGEGGLLSLAFDPQYASNGYFYVYYTDLQHDIVVERYSAGANPNLADPTSALTIIRIPHPQFVNHFGGLVAFGPDGYLHLGIGDGGGSGDPQGNAQDLGVLLGKMLRLDVSAARTGQPYTIPPSNPFFAAQPGRRAEIWAWGLRNPWRFAFDDAQLYIADVGERQREEVDIVPATQGGLNYGWNTVEGSLCFNAASCDRSGLTLPAFEYDHGTARATCSIIGGYVYRGSALPELAGHYFYSDYCGGFLKSFHATATGIAEQRDWGVGNIGAVVSFGRDGQGELYLIAETGRIYKIGRATTQ